MTDTDDITYVKFRYSLPEHTHDWHEICETLVPVFRVHNICTAGYENKNKMGADTHPHIHIHFNTKDSVKNIRARFKTWLKNRNDGRTEDGNAGSENKVYAMGTPKENEGLRSIERFARYPWKQGNRIPFKGEKVPEDWDAEEIKFQIERASAEYALNAENRLKAAKKAEEKAANSTFAKIAKSCEESEPKTFGAVIEVAIDVYVRHEIAMNLQTMTGYCLTYAVGKGMIPKSAICKKIYSIAGLDGMVGNTKYKSYESESESDDDY